ncbi:MAG: hypothetical protein COB45_05765 [Gammaproteobacteria bacterium]|nr:MAG: hypothetical protein COB45_05765 [Gammaproteobacteria bacterium]PHR85121.1 MAG: hypothetical protein COA59_04000 [Colwellia sp.]
MDNTVVKSFTPQQLKAIRGAINIREWRTHSVDFRPTLALPFIPWNFYVVFLFGVNQRALSTTEKCIAAAMFLLIIFITGMTLFGLVFLTLYLFKSWLGIDIFPENSLGLWDEFKRFFD